MQGIILPATRLLEPYFRKLFANQVKRLFQTISFRRDSHNNSYQTLSSGD
jgi:muramidase (phage lysozyme)